MKLTYNWLKDFIRINISARQLADKLTMAGLEVISFEEKDNDFVFEIEITSNRPDWLNVAGIAREIAAITNLKFKNQNLKTQTKIKNSKKENKHFKINFEDRNDCLLYTAAIISDVVVNPAPDWIKKRLELIGCRSINNIVDIINYVLFTYGEPLHAFDLDKIKNLINVPGNDVFKIVVRRAKNSEKIITIDGVERALGSDTLVIAAENNSGLSRPIAVAGVMGGKETEVTEQTKNILLEAAIFNPVVIRKARQKLGISTDSSYRFERGVDAQTVKNAAAETIKLIEDIAAGKCILQNGINYIKPKSRVVDLELDAVSVGLGVKIGAGKIKNILRKLGFGIKTGGVKRLKAVVPSFRQDVKIDRDLIEEIARIYGYENIPATLPALKPNLIASRQNDLVQLAKNILVGLGLNEVITYSLIEQKTLEAVSSGPEAIRILNPLSKEQEILRPAIAASLLRAAAYNLNQKQEPVNIFEIANVYLLPEKGGYPKEELALGITICGIRSRLTEAGCVKEKMGALHLKGILEVFFERIGIRDFSLTVRNNSWEVFAGADREKIGVIHIPAKDTLDHFGIKNREPVIAEIHLDRIFALADSDRKFERLPVYPGISRDISFVIGDAVKVGDILELVQEEAGGLLRDVRIVDFYKGRQIPAGFKGLTISCLFRSDERTLTEDEIAPLHSSLSRALADKFSAQAR